MNGRSNMRKAVSLVLIALVVLVFVWTAGTLLMSGASRFDTGPLVIRVSKTYTLDFASKPGGRRPGIDYAVIRVFEFQFIDGVTRRIALWTNFDPAVGSGYEDTASDDGQIATNMFRVFSGRQNNFKAVDAQVVCLKGGVATLDIAGESFDVSKGGVVLIDASVHPADVELVETDIRELAFDPERLRVLAADPQLDRFFEHRHK